MDDDGNTVLHVIEVHIGSKPNAYAPLVAALIKKGIDLTIRNKDGLTACDILKNKYENHPWLKANKLLALVKVE